MDGVSMPCSAPVAFLTRFRGYVAMAAAVVFFNFATFYYFAVVLTQKAARLGSPSFES